MEADTLQWCHSGWHGHPASPPSHPSALLHILSDQRSPKRLRKENKKPIQNCALPCRSPSPRANKRFYGGLTQQHHSGTNKQYPSRYLPSYKSTAQSGFCQKAWSCGRHGKPAVSTEELHLRQQESKKCYLMQRWDQGPGKEIPNCNFNLAII